MGFLYGAILWACAAAAGPVIIHLLMKPRPRKITLPTLRFVKKSHKANVSRLKLKHIILLAMRMAAIVLLAILLAEPLGRGFRSSFMPSEPVAMVVVVDDSASMNYRLQGRTVGQHGRRVAAEIIRQLPAGSRVAVIGTQNPAESAGFMTEPDLAGRTIVDVPTTYGAKPLGQAMRRAAEMLQKINLPRKEILVVTDMTAVGWQDASAVDEAVSYTAIDCNPQPGGNVAIGEVLPDSPAVPLGTEAILQTTLSCTGAGGEVNLRVDLDGAATDNLNLKLQPGEVRSLRIPVRPGREGIVCGKIQLLHTDGLADDNVRYFTLHVGPPAEILFVAGPGAKDDLTSFLMASAIVPPGPASSGGLKGKTIEPQHLCAETLAKTPLVVLGSIAALRENQWKQLDSYVRKGGRLWVVAGAGMSAEAYNTAAAQQIFPVKLRGQQQLPKPLGFGSIDTSRPLFAPFKTDKNPPLSDIRFYRRMGVESVAPDAEITVRFADKVPAIVTRKADAGEVVFWNFSPTRSWSNLGRLAGQFVVLAGQTCELLLLSDRAPTQFICGHEVELAFPPGQNNPSVRIARPGDGEYQPLPTRGYLPGKMRLVADRLGHYSVAFAIGNSTRRRGFSVNVSTTESDFRPVGKDRLAAIFPREGLRIVTDTADWQRASAMASQPLDLLPAALLVLLAMLIGESFFANRFYKTQNKTTTDIS
ncbi:MAG: BatA and WFA domain-containing protein [Phycisphaerae bacterium]|nr:BatA and WFA domain-containing protein [Phycisphaerae bacterium]